MSALERVVASRQSLFWHLLRTLVCALFMSSRLVEFPQSAACSREPRADRADRKTKGRGRVLVAELRPNAKREHILLSLRKLGNPREQPLHPALIVSARHDIVRRIRRRTVGRQPAKSSRVPSLRAPAIAHHVRRDPVQPGQDLPRPNVGIASPPRLEKHDRDHVLGGAPITQTPEAIVVNHTRMAAKQGRESVRVPLPHTTPQHIVVQHRLSRQLHLHALCPDPADQFRNPTHKHSATRHGVDG